MHVLVLGAGISGLVAALELAQRGIEVTVIEAAPHAGGRTASFIDERGRAVDTGLHVVADHYRNLIEILGRLGVSRHLQWFRKHLYLHTTRQPLSWYFSDLPPPLHLLRPFFISPAPWSGRLGMTLAGLRIAGRTQAELAELDDISYLTWHQRHFMGDGFLLELAEAAADAAAFLSVEEAAARPVLSWMKYLMRNQRAGDVGIWTGTMQDCLVQPLVRAIEQAGGRVRTHTAALRLETDGQRIAAVWVAPAVVHGLCATRDGTVPLEPGAVPERLVCDHVISALPVQGLQRLLGAELAQDAGLAPMMRLQTTSAMSLIVWFDRTITPAPPGAPLVTGCAMRDLIDLATVGRKPASAPGSVYQFVITHAAKRESYSDEALVQEVVRDLHRIWPAAQSAQAVDWAITRIPAAMFAARPGTHALRPHVRTNLSNFFVAGDFTYHEVNASMEGAAVSGRLAANALLRSLGQPGVVLQSAPDPVGAVAIQRLRHKLTRRPLATRVS